MSSYKNILYFSLKMAEDWEAAPAVAETPEIKLFGKWSTDDVQINDISLQVWWTSICEKLDKIKNVYALRL